MIERTGFSKHLLLFGTLALTLSGCGGSQAAADAESDAAGGEGAPASQQLATLDGAVIALNDLGERVTDRLRQMDYQYRSERFALIESALADVIRNRVLTDEAATRGVSLDELVASITEGRVDVTEAEIADWYRRNQSRLQGRSLEDVAPQIRQFLEDQERQQLVAAFAGELEAQRDIRYHVEPVRAAIDLEGAPSAGPADAPVTLVEFSDFECPFCARFFPTLNRIKSDYGDKVRVVYLQLPLTNIHPNAFKASEASLCAHEQDRFWDMHDLLFQEQRTLAVGDLKEKANRLGLDTAEFDACLDSGRQAERIRQEIRQATSLGLTGTPAIFVNGIQVPGGAVPFETVAAVIDRELRRAEAD